MIESYLLPVSQLSRLEKEEMFSLLSRYFQGVIWQNFLEDLRQKNWVILLRLQGILTGFSTLLFYPTCYQGEEILVVYSGDTITDPSTWSSPALAQAWVKGISTLHQTQQKPLYWLLISSGYRTYRFLSIFTKTFYPRYDCPTPPEWQEKIHFLASQRFQSAYDRATGIVRFSQPQVLCPQLRPIPSTKLKDPHVAFFVEKNPGHEQGDELVCLTEFTQSNVTKAGLRVWQTGSPLQIPYPITVSEIF